MLAGCKVNYSLSVVLQLLGISCEQPNTACSYDIPPLLSASCSLTAFLFQAFSGLTRNEAAIRLSIHLAGSHIGRIQLEKGCATMAYRVFGHHAVNAVTTTLQQSHAHSISSRQLRQLQGNTQLHGQKKENTAILRPPILSWRNLLTAFGAKCEAIFVPSKRAPGALNWCSDKRCFL